MQKEIHGAEDMQTVAAEFAGGLAPQNEATVVALHGDLGAGKTTFVQGVARALGVEEPVTSPTFVIEKIYALPEGAAFTRLVHIDAYRLEGSHDLKVLGWDDVVKDGRNLILVEWAEKVEDGIPKGAYHLFFSYKEGEKREITDHD